MLALGRHSFSVLLSFASSSTTSTGNKSDCNTVTRFHNIIQSFSVHGFISFAYSLNGTLSVVEAEAVKESERKCTKPGVLQLAFRPSNFARVYAFCECFLFSDIKLSCYFIFRPVLRILFYSSTLVSLQEQSVQRSVSQRRQRSVSDIRSGVDWCGLQR